MPRKPTRPAKSKAKSKAKPIGRAKKPARAKSKAKPAKPAAIHPIDQLTAAVRESHRNATLQAVHVLQRALLAKMEIVRNELQRYMVALEAAKRSKAE